MENNNKPKNNSKTSGIDKMLKTASGQLGMSADELKTLLNKGDMAAIMSKMKGDDAKKLKSALGDKKISEKLKSSPEMAKFMKDIEDK